MTEKISLKLLTFLLCGTENIVSVQRDKRKAHFFYIYVSNSLLSNSRLSSLFFSYVHFVTPQFLFDEKPCPRSVSTDEILKFQMRNIYKPIRRIIDRIDSEEIDESSVAEHNTCFLCREILDQG